MKGENFSPKNGKVILSDGTIVNLNDFFYDFLYGVIKETMTIITADYTHKKIHDKNYFTVAYLASIASGEYGVVAGTTGEYAINIIPPTVTTSKDSVTVEVYEDVTYTSNGVAIPIYNHNRMGSDSAHGWIEMQVNPTVGNYGTKKIYNDYIAGGTGLAGIKYGASGRNSQEYVFKPNTKYAMRIHNESADTNIVHFTYSWYKEAV